MGRFYKPTRLQFIDYAYRAPLDLIQKNLDKTETNIGLTEERIQNLRELGGEGGLGGIEVMPQHQEHLDKRIEYYESKINEMTQMLSDDPMKYRSMSGQIGDLRKELELDLSQGSIGKMRGQRTQADKWLEAQKKAKVSPERIDAAYTHYTTDWAGGNYEDGKFDPLTLPQTVYDSDANAEAMKLAKGLRTSDYNLGVRVELITDQLGKNESVQGTLVQELEYGSMRDEFGEYIDPTELTFEEKNAIIEEKLAAYANDAALFYWKDPTSKGTGKGKDKDEDKKIKRIRGRGTARDKLVRQSILAQAVDPRILNKVSANEQIELKVDELLDNNVEMMHKWFPQETIRQIETRLNSGDYSGMDIVFSDDPEEATEQLQSLQTQYMLLQNNRVDIAVLMEHQHQMDIEAAELIKNSVFGNLPGTTMTPEFRKEYGNTYYYSNLFTEEEMISKWDIDDISDAEHKKVTDNVKDIIKDASTWDNLTLDSTIQELSGKSFKDLKNSGIIKYEATTEDLSKKEAQKHLASKTYFPKGDGKLIEKNGNYYIQKADGSLWVDPLDIKDGDDEDDTAPWSAPIIEAEYDYTKSTNFELNYDNLMVVSTGAITNDPESRAIRVGVSFTNDKGEQQTGAIFIPLGGDLKIDSLNEYPVSRANIMAKKHMNKVRDEHQDTTWRHNISGSYPNEGLSLRVDDENNVILDQTDSNGQVTTESDQEQVEKILQQYFDDDFTKNVAGFE